MVVISDKTLPARATAASDQVAWRTRAVTTGAAFSAKFSIGVGLCDPERIGIAVALEAVPASLTEEQVQ